MKKAILGNRIYITVNPKLTSDLKEKLTYRIPAKSKFDYPVVIRNYKALRPGLASIPAGREDLIPDDYDIIDKRISIKVELPEFKFKLRESQQAILDEIDSSALINAKVSFGKTFTALAIAGKLKQKMLVVTHTTSLRNQWVQETEKVFGFTPGIIGSGKFDVSTPIVISNIQTLVKKLPQVAKLFGAVVIDECLDYDSQITTKNGNLKIGKIVNQKLPVEVLSLNKNTKELEWKRVVNWFKNPQQDPMIKFTFNNKSKLKCTLNHTVYSLNKGEVPAEYLEEGDWVISTRSFKTSSLLREEIKPLVLGMILGDGSLSTNGISCRLKITHGEAQLDYLKYKASLLLGGVPSDIVTGKSGYKPSNKVHYINSLSFYDLDNWRKDLYSNNSSKTRISKKVADILTVESWAIMYMDDGSLQSPCKIVFSFCELDIPSIENLQNSLLKVFSVESKYFTCTRGFNYLTLTGENVKKFLKKASKFIHPVLRYKLKGVDDVDPFIGTNPQKMFKETSAVQITDIDFENATNGYRYNIEVENNHNYFAGNKLVSNCHHAPSSTFTTVIDAMWCKYKIGLSGTMKRKDGKHVVFPDFFGAKLFRPPAENFMPPKVRIVKSAVKLIDDIPWADRMTKLAGNKTYQSEIVFLAKLYAQQGHNVLLVSDRVFFLETCAEMIGSRAVCITGSIALEDRDDLMKEISCGTGNILCGTRSIFSEGISLDELSCLIIATPMNNEPLLEQLIGRIIRVKEGKLNPVVVDIALLGRTAKNQLNARIGFYMRQGWQIDHIN